ncbi:MAG: hypothetical protein KJ630_17115 [Proteobacteria bacterium]|nr:hypothetical protein [Pseudomonadota bacterium]
MLAAVFFRLPALVGSSVMLVLQEFIKGSRNDAGVLFEKLDQIGRFTEAHMVGNFFDGHFSM